MKIKQINSQNRRDFHADFECESCGFIEQDKSGYDDSYFHGVVIPGMKCPSCGKTSAEAGTNYRPLQTKYPEGMQV